MIKALTHSRPADATLSIGPLLAAPEVLKALGADVGKVLAEAGIRPEQFANPDNLISYISMGRLFARGVEHTGCRHLGLLVGMQGGLNSLGLVGQLVKYSKDVGSALRGLERHFHLRVRGASLILQADDQYTKMGHVVHGPVEAIDQINDGALAEIFNVMRSLCGQNWRPTEVHLSRRIPADVRPFQRFFDSPLRFDAEIHAVVFPSQLLGRMLPAVDAQLRRLLTREIENLERAHGDDFPEQLRSVLRASMATGRVSQAHVAALLSMQSRTLARRLARFGTGFRKLLDETRFETARQMLESTSLDIDQIAAALGYARSSVFIRSFRRWSGTTPAAWRAQRDRAAWAPTGPGAQ